MNRISVLIKETLSCPFHAMRTQQEVCSSEEGPHPDLRLMASKPEKYFCCSNN